eukprot:154622-Rhodomonas_salina.1
MEERFWRALEGCNVLICPIVLRASKGNGVVQMFENENFLQILGKASGRTNAANLNHGNVVRTSGKKHNLCHSFAKITNQRQMWTGSSTAVHENCTAAFARCISGKRPKADANPYYDDQQRLRSTSLHGVSESELVQLLFREQREAELREALSRKVRYAVEEHDNEHDDILGPADALQNVVSLQHFVEPDDEHRLLSVYMSRDDVAKASPEARGFSLEVRSLPFRTKYTAFPWHKADLHEVVEMERAASAQLKPSSSGTETDGARETKRAHH